MKLITTSALILFCAGAYADEVVKVSSLQVKERIQTMEQVNVSAPTERKAEQPSSKAVADLLAEATTIEGEPAKKSEQRSQD